MKVANFLELFLRKQHGQISNRTFGPRWDGGTMPWSVWYKLADATHLVNFKCDFKNGVCRMRRTPDYIKDTYYHKNKRFIKMCCCSGCYGQIGYLKSLPNRMSALCGVAKKFDGGRWKRGFWRPDVGCILPRKFRSTICLTHHCSSGHDWAGAQKIETPLLSRAEEDLLQAIRVGPKWIKAYHKKNLSGRANVENAVNHLIGTLRAEIWRGKYEDSANSK